MRDIERLPSVSNEVYRVGRYVVRLPTRPRIGVDHRTEVVNAELAAAAGIGAEIVFARDDGVLVTTALGGRALRPADLVADPSLLARAGRLLRRVHEGPEFAGRFDASALVRRLRAEVGPSVCDELLAAVDPLVPPAALRPCHNDPWPGNVFLSGDRLALLDWEYSGMGDPMWDLADLSVEADLDDAGDEVLLDAHGDADRERFLRCKPWCDLFWSLWSLVEHAAGNHADDFVSEAERRTARGLRLLRV